MTLADIHLDHAQNCCINPECPHLYREVLKFKKMSSRFSKKMSHGGYKKDTLAKSMAARKKLRTNSRLSSTTQQAIRTGGWVDPSRMGAELKFVDVSTGMTLNTGATFSAAPTLLNAIAAGTSASTRIGRKLIIKSLLLRYTFALAPTSTGGSPLRILVVYDKQANTAAPAITDVLLTDNFHSQNNLSNRDRFVTLCDHISEPIATGNDYCVADVIFKPLSLETMYNAGTDDQIGSITSGSIYLFVAQAGTALTAAPSFIYRSRVRYTDV